MTVPQLIVRNAHAADAAEISRLLEQLGCDVNTQTVRGRLDVHDGVHGAGVVVATDDGGVVGVVASSPAIPRLAEGGCFVRITALAVADTHRGRGVGRCLVEAIEERARAMGASLLEVSSGRRPEREAAHAFYPALGFVDSSDASVVYRKRLGRDGEA